MVMAVVAVVQRMRVPHALVKMHMMPLFGRLVLHKSLLMHSATRYNSANNASAVIEHIWWAGFLSRTDLHVFDKNIVV